MSKTVVRQKLDRASEIGLDSKVENQEDIPGPIWFSHEGNTVYLPPKRGSDSKWYKNLLADRVLKVSVIFNFY